MNIFKTHSLNSDHRPSVLFLNRCYWPDSEATGQLLTDLCEYLARDMDVHVICGQPNSATTDRFLAKGVETRNGVTIHRLSHTRFAKRIPAGRLMNLASFSLSAERYLRKSAPNCDIVISETDPFMLPAVAARHATRQNVNLVCYLQDIYPDVAEAIGKISSGRLSHLVRESLRKAYASADRVVVLGECMRSRLQASPWDLPETKLTTIPNWADCQAIRPQDKSGNRFREKHSLADRFVVMHSGNMGLTQRLDVLVRSTQSRSWPANAVLALVGDGAARPSLERLARESQSDRVLILPYQPRAELSTSLSSADIHVVSMHEQITGCLCPSKLYGILAAGRPVIAIADQATDLCRTVKDEKVGWCCKPGDSELIARAVASAADSSDRLHEMEKRARHLACQRYDRAVVMSSFKNLLNEVITGGIVPTNKQESETVLAS